MALTDKNLTPDEDRLLAAMRVKLHIDDDEHEKILNEMGWTKEEYDQARKGRTLTLALAHTPTLRTAHTAIRRLARFAPSADQAVWWCGCCAEDDPWMRECVVCIDQPATHIILDCFHLCLCEGCAERMNEASRREGKEEHCPKCRAVVRLIHKTY